MVVAADENAAKALHQHLRDAASTRLVLDRSARIGMGVCVTTVGRLRGQEVDRIAVPDLEPDRWPDTRSARNALYVAVTRATGAVLLSTVGDWSPLVRAEERILRRRSRS